MQQVRKFLRLTSGDRRLLISAVLLVWTVRLGLWLLPFQGLRRLLSLRSKVTRAPLTLQEADPACADKVIWAVTTASRYAPAASCLVRALVAQVLLAQQGCPAHLCIGVAKTEAGRLEAHAWIESQGKVILGGKSDLARYTPLPSL
jgi:hypothetical protein